MLSQQCLWPFPWLQTASNPLAILSPKASEPKSSTGESAESTAYLKRRPLGTYELPFPQLLGRSLLSNIFLISPSTLDFPIVSSLLHYSPTIWEGDDVNRWWLAGLNQDSACLVMLLQNALPSASQNTRLQHHKSHWEHRIEHAKAVLMTGRKNVICITSRGESVCQKRYILFLIPLWKC